MDNRLAELILRVTIVKKLHGGAGRIAAYEIVSDKRRQKKAIRTLVTDGYLDQADDDSLTPTNRLFDELEPESVNLIDLWAASRSGWNERKNYDFVRWTSLTDGQKKAALTCPEAFEWHVCYVTPLNYAHDMRDGDLQGPVFEPASDLGPQIAVLIEHGRQAVCERRHRFSEPEFEVVLRCPALTAHVEKTLADEKFAALYGRNLKWALTALSLVPAADAEGITADGGPSWLFSDSRDLGTDPAQWGDRVTEAITDAREGIARLQKRLATLEAIQAGIAQVGGWDAFREQYRDRLREEVAKKQAGQ